MPITYKIDVLAALKERGYTTYRIRRDKVFGERVVQQLREKSPVSWEVLTRLCQLLECQPGDILEYLPGEEIDTSPQDAPRSGRMPGKVNIRQSGLKRSTVLLCDAVRDSGVFNDVQYSSNERGADMKILSIQELCEMDDTKLRDYVKRLELYCRITGLYDKAEAGTLTETEEETFGRIMELFRWVRINAD